MSEKKNILKIDEVKKVAALARLDLSQEEIAVFKNQLSDILDFFKQLAEVDVKDTATTNQSVNLTNVTRPDEAQACSAAAELVKMAPEKKDNLVKVKAVFGG